METSFMDIILSDTFIFYTGTGDKKDAIKVPSKAIAATSDKFAALVDGEMKEAQDRFAELHEVETEDFIRFVEYAIRGDYTVPLWSVDKKMGAKGSKHDDAIPSTFKAPASAESEVECEAPRHYQPFGVSPFGGSPFGGRAMNFEASPDGFGGSKKGKSKAKNKSSIRDWSVETPYLFEGDPIGSLLEGFKPRANDKANQNFTPVFLAHARLYTFADANLVHPLKELALKKLYQTLSKFKLFNERIGDIIQLARYAYNNNMDRQNDGKVDKLRLLVVQYIVYKLDIIGRSAAFDALMADGGEFAVDFWHLARDHLISQ